MVVPTPDYAGRQEIIILYLKKILHTDVDIPLLARGTTGFTGADLENMINQAALRAAIDGAELVSMKHLENARDKGIDVIVIICNRYTIYVLFVCYSINGTGTQESFA